MECGIAMVNGTSYTIKRAIFAVANNSNTDIVAAVTGKRIRVIHFLGTSDSATGTNACSWKLRSATTDITNTMITSGAGGPFNSGPHPFFCRTATAEALNLICASAAAGLNGVVLYVEENP